jgi:hypothetical protein
LRRQQMEGRMEPVEAPFPRVPGNGIQTVAIGTIAIDGRGGRVAIFSRVFRWERPLPDVAEMLAVGGQFIAPRI